MARITCFGIVKHDIGMQTFQNAEINIVKGSICVSTSRLVNETEGCESSLIQNLEREKMESKRMKEQWRMEALQVREIIEKVMLSIPFHLFCKSAC